MWWLVILKHHRGQSCLHSCLLCTPQISSISVIHATCRGTLMTSQWLGVLGVGTSRSTGSWWGVLSSRNHLLLNVSKTKDIQRWRLISGGEKTAAEKVRRLKQHLSVHLNDRLNWRSNSDDVYKKGMSNTPYFLRKLRSFGVCSMTLEIFYPSVEASTLLSSAGGQHRWQRAEQDQQTNSQGRNHHWPDSGGVWVSEDKRSLKNCSPSWILVTSPPFITTEAAELILPQHYSIIDGIKNTSGNHPYCYQHCVLKLLAAQSIYLSIQKGSKEPFKSNVGYYIRKPLMNHV